jgi:hypothetical protein
MPEPGNAAAGTRRVTLIGRHPHLTVIAGHTDLTE